MVHLQYHDGRRIDKGSRVLCWRGEWATVTGWELPRHSGSTGRVFVRFDKSPEREGAYYPAVFDLRWSDE